MIRSGLHGLKKAVDASLAPFGLKLARRDDHDWSDTANFIPLDSALEAAKQAGMSVGDYVDSVMNGVPGSSQNTIDKMAEAGVFDQPIRTVVEIGPGTGRYLDKTVTAARPDRYEIYETAGPWLGFLAENYNVTVQPTDGYSLSATLNNSVDLVHAHKVFSTVPFIVTCSYLQEMVRTVRPGGWIVFDLVTEKCLSVEALKVWAKSGIRNGS